MVLWQKPRINIVNNIQDYWTSLNEHYIAHALRLGKNRLVVSAVICSQNKVLVVRRSKEDTYPGLWEFPGGGVDDVNGESVVQACRRESLEETGIDLPLFPSGEILVHPTRTALRVVLRFDLDGLPQISLSDEHDEARFLDLDEAKLTQVEGVIIHDSMRPENQGVMNLLFGNSMGNDS